VIDRNSSFDGRFETEHDLRIEGTVSGEIVCKGTFIVDREATARVRVQARDGHILGHFEGDLVCAGKLTLAATAQVSGTFKAALLVVEEGATVSGTVDTTQGATAPRQKAPASSQNGAAEHEPTTVTRVPRREPPSFALVASDDRAGSADRN
jgi:cytoskeletal protein CcmA (bactofilin family)